MTYLGQMFSLTKLGFPANYVVCGRRASDPAKSQGAAFSRNKMEAGIDPLTTCEKKLNFADSSIWNQCEAQQHKKEESVSSTLIPLSSLSQS